MLLCDFVGKENGTDVNYYNKFSSSDEDVRDVEDDQDEAQVSGDEEVWEDDSEAEEQELEFDYAGTELAGTGDNNLFFCIFRKCVF